MMENTPAKSGSSRRKSCLTCIVAKARCTPREGSLACERCLSPPPESKKRKVTRVEQLEEKVESLVALLTTQRDVNLASPPDKHILTPATTATSPDSGSSISQPRRLSGDDDQPDYLGEDLVSPAFAEELLVRFKVHKTPNFPFVVIPPSMNAATLRVQAPFLFLAIANSFVDKTEDLQEKIFTKINETISKRIVMNGEKSLELLQGLIVILAWFHFHTESVHQLSLIRHISISLVGDLGLDRPPGKDPNLGLKDELHCHTTITTDFVGSLAARRAFLGTYYLACIGGMFRRQQIVMKHTKWIDECCKTLKDEREYDTDVFIEPMVRSHTLFSEILHIPESLYSGGDSLIEMVTNGFLQQLAKIEAEFPTPGNEAQQILLKAMPAFIYESALFAHSQSAITAPHLHAAHLWKILSHSRAVIEAFDKVPNQIVLDIPLNVYSVIWYLLIVFTRVLFLPSAPGWDAQLVRTEARGDELIDLMLAKIRDLRALSRDDQGGIFLYWHKLVTNLSALWKKILASGIPPIGGPGGPDGHTLTEEVMGMVEVSSRSTPADQSILLQPAEWSSWNEAEWQKILNDFSFFPAGEI